MSRPGLQRAGSSIAVANKTIVLVTGGNTGIGYEIVKSLAETRPDFQILLGCRDTQKGEMAAASMGAPRNVNPIQLDITDDRSIDHCYKAIEQLFGRLDILINNAGTAGTDLKRTGKAHTIREVWSHVYNINVISTGVLTETLIPLLEQSKDPRIIFISSLLGSIGKMEEAGMCFTPEIMHYNSSKGAVNHLAKQYALKYPKFKVNSCCPGHRGTGLNDISKEGDKDPALGAVNAVKLATDSTGITGTYSNTEGTIPW